MKNALFVRFLPASRPVNGYVISSPPAGDVSYSEEKRDRAKDVCPPSGSVYGFFVLPRSTSGIALEFDVRHLIQDPPVWKERVRLEKVVTPKK
jgi:hypothetical protein